MIFQHVSYKKTYKFILLSPSFSRSCPEVHTVVMLLHRRSHDQFYHIYFKCSILLLKKWKEAVIGKNMGNFLSFLSGHCMSDVRWCLLCPFMLGWTRPSFGDITAKVSVPHPQDLFKIYPGDRTSGSQRRGSNSNEPGKVKPLMLYF